MTLKPLNAVPTKFWMSCGDADYMRLMVKAGFKLVAQQKDAEITLFTGGWDVNPLFYGEEAIPATGFSHERDKEDLEAWRGAKDQIKLGICRGGQFLNVMNGGKLWQDVDRHAVHDGHMLTDQFTQRQVKVSSTHHQMFRPAHDAILVALARESTTKQSELSKWTIKNDGKPIDEFLKRDYEVLYYPRTRSLCFQPHPEFLGWDDCRDYFYSCVRRVIDGTFIREATAAKAAKKKG